MNCFYTYPLSLYYPVWQGLGIQIVWLLIVFLFATLILIGKYAKRQGYPGLFSVSAIIYLGG